MANELVLKLRLDGDDLVVNGVKRVSGAVDGMGGSASKAIAHVAHLGGAFVVFQQAAGSLIGASRALDEFTTAASRLSLVAVSANAAAAAQGALFKIAQESRVEYTALAETYARLARSGNELGVSQTRMLGVTKSISQAMTISGGSAESMKAALIQLSQGFASGTLRGEELNSVLEQAPRLAQAIADGMGVSVGELKKLGEEGKLTAKAVMDALEGQSAVLTAEFAKMTPTISQAFTVFKDGATKAFYEFDKGAGISNSLAASINNLGKSLGDAGGAAKEFGEKYGTLISAVGEVAAFVAAAGAASKLLGLLGRLALFAASPMVIGVTIVSTLVKGGQAHQDSDARLERDIWYGERDGIDVSAEKAELAKRKSAAAANAPLAKAVSSMRQSDRDWEAEQKAAEDALINGRKKAFSAYMTSVKSQKDKQVTEENDKFKALTATIGTSGKEYEVALIAHNAKIAEINEKGSGSGVGDAKKAHNEVVASNLEKAKEESAALAASNKFLADREKAISRFVLDEEKFTKSLITGNEKLKDELATLGMSAIEQANYQSQKLLTAEASDLATASELESAAALLETQQLMPDVVQKYRELAAAKRESAAALGEKAMLDTELAAKKTAIKAADDSNKAWQKFADDIERSLTDSLYRSFEAGAGFGETFVSSLKNTLKAAALKLVIQYAVSGGGNLVGSIGNAAVNAVMGTSGSNGGSGTNWLGTASNVQSAYSLYNNAGIAAQWLGGSMSTANAAGTVYANAAGTGLDGLLATNGAYGTAAAGAEAGAAGGSAGASSSMGAAGTIAWVAAIIMGMYMSSEAWKNGVRWEDYTSGSGDQLRGTQKYDAEIGLRTIHDRPYAQLFGKDFVESEFFAVMGGSSLALQLRKQAWGGNITTGVPQLTGNFSEQGFTGGQTAQEITDHGGWFTSTKRSTEIRGISAAMDNQLDYMYYSISETLLNVGDIFGDSSLLEKIKSFSMSVNVAAGDSTFAVVADQLTAALGNHLLPSITAIKNEGEKWQDTLARALIQANAVNRVFVLTGKTLASAFGRDNSDRILYMSDRLVDLFGTIDEMSASVSTYYAAFYTPAEQVKQAWVDLTDQLIGMNQEMPDSVVGYRALVDGMDLTTESGQSLFASLVKLSPAFAAAVEGTDKLAQETAAKLLIAYTGDGKLPTAILSVSASALAASASAAGLAATVGSISTIFLDASSPLLTFGAGIADLSPDLTAAQLASASLLAEIDSLRLGAASAQIDFAGLGTALSGVNTATFVATVSGVFDALASRITGVINSISTERAAVREAALSIINPTVMSRDAILRSIGAINTALPSQSGIVAANASLSAADQRKAAADAQVANYAGFANLYSSQYGAQQSNINGLQAAIAAVNAGVGTNASKALWEAELGRQRVDYQNYSALASQPQYVWPGEDGGSATGYSSYYEQRRDEALIHVNEIQNQINVWNQQISSYAQGINASSAAMSVISGQYQSAINSMSAWQGEAAAAAAQQASAQATVKASILAYAAAIQAFAVDASKSVTKLSRLREETVKYYEAQKALAELMGTSAAGLRATVADYRYAQLTDAEQYTKLQTDYATAYSLALSTSGESLSGYGDRLNNILPALLEKAQAVLSGDAYAAAAATAIARAEAIADKLESTAPTNYAADSLSMLTNIDATLAALDASASSAEKIISDAVKAGADRTAAGLHGVIAALTGQTIPAFATGGAFTNGVVTRPTAFNMGLMGEAGEEAIMPLTNVGGRLGVHVAGAGGGNTARLEALVERQAQQLESMSYELRALASSNARLARLAERQDREGINIRNDPDTPLHVSAVVA